MAVDITSIQLDYSWKEILKDEFQKPYFSDIKDFLLQEKQSGQTIFPEGQNIFNAFNSTPFDKVRVVILGQDPYHGTGEAHGLCFSVQDWVRQPPSLKNIFKELQSDLGIVPPKSGNLLPWTKQWVFLLNAILTVRKDQPASHKDIGWQDFTDAVIRTLSEKKQGLVFVLWWAYAQWKKDLIDTSRHFIIESPHPSPFSAYKWFFWSKPFSKINTYISLKWEKEIDWNLS